MKTKEIRAKIRKEIEDIIYSSPKEGTPEISGETSRHDKGQEGECVSSNDGLSPSYIRKD